MLKRLKIKFVIVIMSIVTVLLAAVFGLVMHLTRQSIERESIQMMRAAAFPPPGDVPGDLPEDAPGDAPGDAPKRKPDRKPDRMTRLPVFTVSISEDGGMTVSGSADYFNLTDETLLRELADTALRSEEQTGVIAGYDLRFMKSDQRNLRSVVFADISSEKAMLRGMIRNFVLMGLLGYAAFFVISLLLAKWVTKPVEQAWNEQKQFVADASHELKTPLTVIMTNAEMLTDKSYTEDDREQFTGNILSTSKRMRGLVESLLELARLDSRRTPAAHDRLDYSKLVNDSILPFEPLFYENQTELSAEIEPGITVEGDKDRLRQVVTILLDNALKYCDPADCVSVRLKRQSAGCLLSVSGRGTPLSKEQCQDIFKRFYRVDPSRNDGESYGLGLSIAESIVREHGGKIWAESENGYNTFFVSLPA